MRQSLWQEFDHSFKVHADRVAIETSEASLTYAQLDNWSRNVTAQLASLEIRAGDSVALYLRNCLEFVVCDVAIARLGGVKVPINYMLPDATVDYIVRHSGAKAIVVDRALASDDRIGEFSCHVLVRQTNTEGPVDAPATSLAQLSDSGAADVAPAEQVTGASPAAIYFTGGTTGHPKAVSHSQASTVALHYAQMLEAEISDSDRLLLMTPLAHAAGLFAQSALIRGATSVIRDGFDARSALDSFVRDRVTWTFLVPTMLYRLMDVVGSPDEMRTSLRTVVYGAAPISPVRLERALAMFGPVFVQLYGQTECPNWGTKLSKADHDPGRPSLLASCGKASIMADVRVIDAEGEPVGAGQTGEICLRSPYTLTEYVGDPAATVDKFLGDWIKTGDIGALDADGYLYLKDRKSDMIITGGMNVYCREVEDVLITHPLVHGVAVIGIPHDDWGESVHAVVVVADAASLSEAELIDWARSNLASYAVPKSVEFVDSLPETPFGKVDKKVLRQPYWGQSNRNIS